MAQSRLLKHREMVAALSWVAEIELALISFYEDSVPDPDVPWDLERRTREINVRLERLRWAREEKEKEYGGREGDDEVVGGRPDAEREGIVPEDGGRGRPVAGIGGDWEHRGGRGGDGAEAAEDGRRPAEAVVWVGAPLRGFEVDGLSGVLGGPRLLFALGATVVRQPGRLSLLPVAAHRGGEWVQAAVQHTAVAPWKAGKPLHRAGKGMLGARIGGLLFGPVA